MKYAGIDWATNVHVVCLLDESGTVLDEWSVPHAPEGIAQFLQRLGNEGGPEQVLVAVESGAPLLLDQLLAASYRVYPINPKQADRYRDRYTLAGAKDDRRDARVLADAIRTDRERMRTIELDSELTEEIRLRDRARSRLVQQRTALGNQLRQVLSRYFPVLLELDRAMHDPFLLEILRSCPDAEQARKAPRTKLKKLISGHGLRVLDADGLAELLKRPSFYVPGYAVAACRDEALDMADQLRLLNEKIDAADAKLRDLFKKHPDRELLRSLPGLGNCLAARVVAELGETRARSLDATALQAFAGTAPVTRRSGKRGVISIRMRKGCNRDLQAALFHMARCSVKRSGWANAYLEHLKARGVRYATAVRALSNKWAKILWAVLNTKQPYDEELHRAHLIRNKVPWALPLATAGSSAA